MSTDFIGLFDRAMPDLTPTWLSERLAANPPELKVVVTQYRRLWRQQAWTFERNEDGQEVLIGPGGLAFSFRSRLVEVYHMIPFRLFASDQSARAPLRRLWQFLATTLGSLRAIYTHELMPHGGTNLTEIEAQLRARIGPPAKSFDELRDAEYFGPSCWFVDDFADLPERDGPGPPV